MRIACLCAVALVCSVLPALADGDITLNLETPVIESTAPRAESQNARPSVTTVTGHPSANRQIAKLGTVVADRANIYSRQSSKSRVYSVCVKDTPLAIVSTSGDWYGVMMIDGSTGWAPASKVKLLDYGVVATPPRTGSYASRGDLDRGAVGNSIIQTALQYTGVPYVFGGTSTTSGIDCSAFVRMVFAQNGVKLPRVARDQANVGAPVTGADLQAGDRLYFACKHSYVDHCGIYMGNGYFVHASASRGGVAVDRLSNKFYSANLVAAVR